MNAPFRPPLDPRFCAPEGWRYSEFTTREGQHLRYGWASPARPRGLVPILPGLSEFIEKYFETAHDLLRRDFAVAVLDWRGQGKSWRHYPDRRHHDDFANDVADAMGFVGQLDGIPGLSGLPRLALGHSMGGHIALRLMHDFKDVFRAGVMTAPMMGINLPMNAEGPVRAVAEAASRMGWGHRYFPTFGPWSETRFLTNANLLTTDPERRGMQLYWMRHHEDLRMGGITHDWMRAALASIQVTRDPAYLRDISTPILMVAGSREMVVCNRSIRTAASALPAAELREIDGALHEVLMEKDAYRNQFWDAFDSFVARTLGPQ